MTCDRIFSEGLLRFLRNMRTPEIFICCTICPAARLPGTAAISWQLSDLPTYLRSRQMADVSLTDLQYQVLSFVSTHPKAGRLAIKNGLADG